MSPVIQTAVHLPTTHSPSVDENILAGCESSVGTQEGCVLCSRFASEGAFGRCKGVGDSGDYNKAGL